MTVYSASKGREAVNLNRLPNFADILNGRPAVADLFAAVKAERDTAAKAVTYCGMGRWVARYDPLLIAMRLPLAEEIVCRRDLLKMMPACRGECACHRGRGAIVDSEMPNRCAHRFPSGKRCLGIAYAGSDLCHRHELAAATDADGKPVASDGKPETGPQAGNGGQESPRPARNRETLESVRDRAPPSRE